MPREDNSQAERLSAWQFLKVAFEQRIPKHPLRMSVEYDGFVPVIG